jgi:hypothetical protein
LARDRQDLEARQAEAAFNRDQQERFNRYEEGQEEQPNQVMQQMQRQRQARQARQEAAATNIQRILRGNRGRMDARNTAIQVIQQGALTRQAADDQRQAAADQRFAQRLARAPAILQGIEQANAQEQMQTIAQQVQQSRPARQARQATAAAAARRVAIAEAAEARRVAAAAQRQNQRVEQSLNAARERRQRYAEQQVAADAADAAAATKIQQALRNKKAINTFANLYVQNQRSEQSLNAARERRQRYAEQQAAVDAADAAAANQRFAQRLARAPAILQGIEQANEQEQMQIIAQSLNAARERRQRQAAARQAEAQKRESNANVEKLVNDYMIRKISIPEFELYQSLDNAGKQRFIEEIRQKVQNQPATLIKSVLRGHKGRKQYEQDKIDRLVQLSIEAQQMGQMQQLSPTALTALSGATTVAEQEQAGLPKVRSDLGSTRAPYATKKKMEKEQKQLMKGLTPEERRILQQEQTQAQTRAQRLTSMLQRRGPQRLEDIREALGETQGPQGSGFRKPPKRQVKINPEEKKKNRLQLVIAQIKAGNTNPKLILEVNKLYKSLYDIDNAYMMLK